MNKSKRVSDVSTIVNRSASDETYPIAVHCSNCGHHWTENFRKGSRAEEGFSRDRSRYSTIEKDGKNIECPNCGCSQTIHKSRF